jgi:hypothetical protein
LIDVLLSNGASRKFQLSKKQITNKSQIAMKIKETSHAVQAGRIGS